MNRAAMELMPYQTVCPANCLMLKLENFFHTNVNRTAVLGNNLIFFSRLFISSDLYRDITNAWCRSSTCSSAENKSCIIF
jgi:hypothetical protein